MGLTRTNGPSAAQEVKKLEGEVAALQKQIDDKKALLQEAQAGLKSDSQQGGQQDAVSPDTAEATARTRAKVAK